jgi:hypothetical protein
MIVLEISGSIDAITVNDLRPPRCTFSALNLMVFTTELKLLIIKISAPSADGLKNVSFRKE